MLSKYTTTTEIYMYLHHLSLHYALPICVDGYTSSTNLAGGTTQAAPLGQKKNLAEPTWRVSLEHDLATDVLGYVSYNRGFKSGVFNAGTATAPVVEPEIVDAYEGGVKATFLDRKEIGRAHV